MAPNSVLFTKRVAAIVMKDKHHLLVPVFCQLAPPPKARLVCSPPLAVLIVFTVCLVSSKLSYALLLANISVWNYSVVAVLL